LMMNKTTSQEAENLFGNKNYGWWMGPTADHDVSLVFAILKEFVFLRGDRWGRYAPPNTHCVASVEPNWSPASYHYVSLCYYRDVQTYWTVKPHIIIFRGSWAANRCGLDDKCLGSCFPCIRFPIFI
jgi:hypothetical protein